MRIPLPKPGYGYQQNSLQINRRKDIGKMESCLTDVSQFKMNLKNRATSYNITAQNIQEWDK